MRRSKLYYRHGTRMTRIYCLAFHALPSRCPPRVLFNAQVGELDSNEIFAVTSKRENKKSRNILIIHWITKPRKFSTVKISRPMVVGNLCMYNVSALCSFAFGSPNPTLCSIYTVFSWYTHTCKLSHGTHIHVILEKTMTGAYLVLVGGWLKITGAATVLYDW